MEHNSRMKEITGNLKRDMKDLLGESANVVTGFFRRGVCTVRAVADKWRTFTQDISAAVDELMKPPFLADGPEAPLPTMDEGAEPVVTVVESMDRNFPIGKQMPLSQANDEVARADAAYLEEELTAQPVKVRIDYIQNGQTDRYYLPLHIGAGGNLLEQMERHLETYRADPDRVAALFQQTPEEYRREFETEFTPFLHESLEGLSQETLRYFQRHCDISELARQFESQVSVLPEGQRAGFAERARRTILSLRRTANGAEVRQERTAPEVPGPEETPLPIQGQEQAGVSTGTQKAAPSAEAGQPRPSVKVKLHRLKQEQAGQRQRPKVRLTPQR